MGRDVLLCFVTENREKKKKNTSPNVYFRCIINIEINARMFISSVYWSLSLSLCVQQTFSVWIYLLHIFCCFDKHSLPYQIYFWPKCCCTRRLNCILWYDRPFACIHINIRSTADKRTPCKMMRISGYAIAATMFWLQYYLYEMCTLYSHTHHMGYSI